MRGILRFFGSTIGMKLLVALTGILLFGFLLGHASGNLLFYAGADQINNYAKLLHAKPGLLWCFRIGLLVSLVLHLSLTFLLTLKGQNARPVQYQKQKSQGSTWATRTMIWSGLVIVSFVVFHLLHLTFGTIHPDFPRFTTANVHHNLIVGFSEWWVVLVYVVALFVLGAHLSHAIWSFFQTLGLNHPRYNTGIRVFAWIATILISGAFMSIPIAVLLGVGS